MVYLCVISPPSIFSFSPNVFLHTYCFITFS